MRREFSGTNQLIPLPEFPLLSASGTSTRSEVYFRRFGIIEEDLGFDFASPNRAGLATRLLDACLVDPNPLLPENFFRDLSVGKRIECLLHLALGGDDVLRFPFKCFGCGAELELELTLAEISELQGHADAIEIVRVELGAGPMEFHKSSGHDQEKLSNSVFSDEIEAASEIILRIAVEPTALDRLAPDDVEAIESAMADVDPLVDFKCGIHCGECGQLNDHELDLFETALDMLSRAQRRLLLSVHRFASKYHWSEREIFAVPDWRRRQYLELIGAKL